VTALAIHPDTRTGCEPTASLGVDQAIRVSAAIAVLAVAGIAAYVSYWHAYAVVCAHGGSGATARLEPATIDGLVYASSMVNLYAARHRLPVPVLARWLLALGIVATLAANMAQGWSHGPVGAVIAAWPAASLVGSYELLMWIIRTAAAGGLPRGSAAADHSGPQADHPDTSLRSVAAQPSDAGPATPHGSCIGLMPDGSGGPVPLVHPAGTSQTSGPGQNTTEQADQPADRPAMVATVNINAAAVAAYRGSIQNGEPLSERKLAGMFGTTSRRWARSRMAEARQDLVPG
jgi:Protein of unknown function (DUF2637)